jgi:hypothetical protein
LIEWAERHNGILVVKEAKRALLAAGLIKPGKGVGWMTYGTIANMDCWEKIEPGVSTSLKIKDGQVFSLGKTSDALKALDLIPDNS